VPDVQDIIRRDAETIAAYLAAVPALWPGAPVKLIESMSYSLLAGGKRLRPTLVLESCRAVGGDAGSPSALAAASAMELIHTFSLVHDDLPAMDDDDLRRGRPTNHKVFGEAMAILAGDAMVTSAFELLAVRADPSLSPRLIAELAGAAGPAGMIGGQVLDMDGQNRSLTLDELRALHAKKTGALLVASCRMGAICGGADDATIESLTRYARHMGLAFQIVDDVLDVTSTPEQLGKATHKDADRGKNTYPRLMGLDPAREAASGELSAALQTLTPFGDRGASLAAIARFIVERSS
jgi:geranylgeranyl diphosphate synthase type II